MEWLPVLKLGWLNGWLMLAIFYVVFAVLMLLFPRAVVSRLYDRSGWSLFQSLSNRLGKVFSLACYIILIMAPLKLGQPVFVFGVVLFMLGFAVMIVALFNYRDTALDRPVTRGIYHVSRNPQWVSVVAIMLAACLAVGSWAAVLLLGLMAVCYHYRILGEEQACLDRYGEAFRTYMQQVPRYFLIF